MRPALDFDGTYTEDPELWDGFIAAARSRGHEVLCVTMRHEHEGARVRSRLEGRVDAIVYTGRKAKRPFLEGLGLAIDVWVDDSPHWVNEDATD
ncbi:hypothetical protein [Ramlibacter alkalitolerans]|uniref:HAD family hydrolase n=1 Tax=Ramlibacter alkalitolerans TaxID=2039631 RepID=A0ABS1JTZ6_9BURK|nr:hypothetical protein [Ramlibacter alkalitolerans]MBL0427702.1 hypothetical protein [Ramlibacter alkalitolerans]